MWGGVLVGARLETTTTLDSQCFSLFEFSREKRQFVEILGDGMVGGMQFVLHSMHVLRLSS